MTDNPSLILQVPRGSAIERQLREARPAALAGDNVLVQTGPTDDLGNLEALGGDVVLTVPSLLELERQADEFSKVLRHAEAGGDPLVIVVGAAEQVEDSQAEIIAAAMKRARRPVFLRIIRPSEG